MNKTILKRLAVVEKKLWAETVVPEWRESSEEITVLFEMMEIFQKMCEMEEANLTPEERVAKHELEAQEDEKFLLERICSDPYYGMPKVWDPVRRGWCLPPEEEAWLNKDSEEEKKDIEYCRAWLASEERVQFEKEYAEFCKKQGGRTDDYLG